MEATNVGGKKMTDTTEKILIMRFCSILIKPIAACSKKLTFWKDKYEFDNLGLRIEGNIWDLNFKLLDDRDQVIAEIRKELFHLTSTYTVTVYEDSYADLVISLCVAIDYVEMLESQSN